MEELCEPNVVAHSKAVCESAREIALLLLDKGLDVDVESVEIGALLHDIGRSESHGIDHGVIGARILENNPELRAYSRFCLTHIGAGISRDEASALGLPAKDYMPRSIEEKIVAHADNITLDGKKADINETIKKMKKILGAHHPAISRVRELGGYIDSFLYE